VSHAGTVLLAELADRIGLKADGAGYSHALTAALSEQRLEFSVGYPVTDAVRDAIAQVPKWAWQVASNGDGDLREHADVVDVTGRLDLSKWTKHCPYMRVIVRRELPHLGATLDSTGRRQRPVPAVATGSRRWRTEPRVTGSVPSRRAGPRTAPPLNPSPSLERRCR